MREKTNFRNLRVLLVGGRPSSVQIMRTVFGLVGIGSVVVEPQSRRAIELLSEERADAVFCDDHCESVSGVAFPLAARRAPGVLDPMIPIFLLCSAARLRQIEQARDTGVTDVLARPLSAATIIRKLQLALANPRPFIVAADFFGPDRRSKRRGQFSGAERRKRSARKVKVTLPDTTDAGSAEI